MKRFLLSLSGALVTFGPLIMMGISVDRSSWQVGGMFMLVIGLCLMDLKIGWLEKTVARQGAMIEDLRKLAAAHHPGLEFGASEEA